MSSGTPYWTHILDDFVAFCSQYYPVIRPTIVGASVEEVEDLEEMIGIPLPPEYGAFLRTMGNTSPHTLGKFLQYSTFGVRAVKDFYGIPGIRAPRDAVYLWTYEVDTPYDIFIRTGGGECDGRPLVQCGWSVDPDSGALLDEEPDEVLLGGSLLQFLYEDAFLSLRDPLLPYVAELREPTTTAVSEERHLGLIAAFRTVAERLDFKLVAFMNGAHVFYNRPDASLKLYAQPSADVIYGRARDERELARICEILSDSLDVVRWG